jgi:hypothetical protein
MEERIELLGYDLLINFNKTFTSKRMHGNTGEHVYHDRQVVKAFTQAGYTLKSNGEDENGWMPLNQVKQPSTASVQLN